MLGKFFGQSSKLMARSFCAVKVEKVPSESATSQMLENVGIVCNAGITDHIRHDAH